MPREIRRTLVDESLFRKVKLEKRFDLYPLLRVATTKSGAKKKNIGETAAIAAVAAADAAAAKAKIIIRTTTTTTTTTAATFLKQRKSNRRRTSRRHANIRAKSHQTALKTSQRGR